MKLKITDGARREIQKEVDELRKSPKYFNIKLDRVKLYFPIIEEVLKSEGVPEDFKYLSVQESGLVSDRVSSSNAVGYWQFKDFTGREVGLRIDRNVDERLNIVSSTKGAAKYFKRHNFFFKNWVYTILAHMTGMGGAKKYVDAKLYGAKKMTIDTKTHWYVKRFLAHKIAFEGDAKGNHSAGLKLVEYTKGQGKSLVQIANNFDIPEDSVKKYNKWLKRGKVPSEKEYTIIIPVKNKVPKMLVAANKENTIKSPSSSPKPQLGKELNRNKTIFIKINGIQSILAKNSETAESLAAEGGVTVARFLRYNDLKPTDAIVEGETYYLRAKKRKARVYYHTAEPNETLWDISQKFGVKLSKLAKMNRMSIIDELEPGRLMWLRKTRPKDVKVEIRELPTEEEVEEILGDKVVTTDVREIVNESTDSVQKDTSDEKVKPKVVGNKKDFRKHKVSSGETLYSISKIYNVEVIDLMELNNTNGEIDIDQVLLIPASKGPQQTPAEPAAEEKPAPKKLTHTVAPGDTFYKISKKYKITVDKLLELNQKDNFDLSVGEELIIQE
ncbi:MAG: LysM peptidoglycan-binding domain-containing protein [Cyclobacteriaceae bacterium]